MARILWGSEQPTRPTGYGVVSREIIKRLIKDYGHEIHVIGWDHNGEPIKHEEGWTMLHAGLQGFGGEPLNKSQPDNSPTVLDMHINMVKPDIYLSLIDCWFIGHAVLTCNRERLPYIAYTPIDGWPISYQWANILGNVHTPLFMSEFGKKEFAKFVEIYNTESGTGAHAKRLEELNRFIKDAGPMIYHGVDEEVFKMRSTTEKENYRKQLGIGHETLLVSVGRNGNRKQIPRLLEALKLAVEKEPNADIGLILHCGDPTDSAGMGGWNLPQLVEELGLTERVRFSDSTSNPLFGVSREELSMLYGMSDAHILATAGEGFGIPSAEAMSCGLPIILPDNSTGPELVGEKGERGWLIPCDTHITGPKWGVNMELVNIEAMADAILEVHNNKKDVRKKGKAARQFVEKNLTWDIIAKQFHELIEATIAKDTPYGV